VVETERNHRNQGEIYPSPGGATDRDSSVAPSGAEWMFSTVPGGFSTG